MTDKQLITFVLPVFNEELNVEELTKKINATMQPLGLDYELLFVDDGSSDGSFKLLTRMQQADAPVGHCRRAAYHCGHSVLFERTAGRTRRHRFQLGRKQGVFREKRDRQMRQPAAV
jgi:glycosyltransferase involved in cell wall biosynthesis